MQLLAATRCANVIIGPRISDAVIVNAYSTLSTGWSGNYATKLHNIATVSSNNDFLKFYSD